MHVRSDKINKHESQRRMRNIQERFRKIHVFHVFQYKHLGSHVERADVVQTRTGVK
jgi:hypothetical protein